MIPDFVRQPANTCQTELIGKRGALDLTSLLPKSTSMAQTIAIRSLRFLQQLMEPFGIHISRHHPLASPISSPVCIHFAGAARHTTRTSTGSPPSTHSTTRRHATEWWFVDSFKVSNSTTSKSKNRSSNSPNMEGGRILLIQAPAE
jgi:hypothetical protein